MQTASFVCLMLATLPSGWDESPLSAKTGPPEAVHVIRVIDGDTIVVSQAGRSGPFRLIGVDCPEAGGRGKPVEWFANESSAYVRSLLDVRSVYLEFDPTGNKIDRYGRTLAHVYRVPDRLWINREIVTRGYGFALTRFPFAYLDEFRQAERSAREAGRGLWGTGGAYFKKSHRSSPRRHAEPQCPEPANGVVERNLTVDLSVACSLPALGGSLSMSPARYRS